MMSLRGIRFGPRGVAAALALAASLLFLTGLSAPSARAADVGRGTVRVVAEFDGRRVEDVEMRLYYVASPDGEWTAGFEDYKLKLETEDEARVGAMATTLKGLISRDSIPADVSGRTDATGVAEFADLKPGVWLFTGDDHADGDVTYRVRAGIFVIHSSESRTVEIKYETERPRPTRPETTIRKVVKIWDDDGTGRPSSVTMELLRDGRVWDSVELSRRNEWRHTWADLDADHEWTVVERDVPTGYECVVEQRGVVTSVTNVREPVDDPPPEIPPWTPPVTEDDPTDSSSSSSSSSSTIPTPPETETKIPQTGTTWYLVPATAGVGVVCVVVGWFLLRKGDDRDE